MMKTKFAIPALSLLSLFLMSGHALAADTSVPITGTAFGDKIGLLHFDYATAVRPSANAQFDQPSYYVGPTKQFYISPQDPAFTGPGADTVTARVGTQKTIDCDTTSCRLRGFVWSDTIGWMALDGDAINDAVDTATGFAGLDDSVGDPYPSSFYPRIKKSGAMVGFAWNQYTGWVDLASDNNLGTTTAAASQTTSDWGAWLEASATPLVVGGEPIGRPFHGYIWSEKLGWIKLGIENNEFAFDFQAYTNWVPDDTSPIVLSPDKAWFAVGVNTGYVAPTLPAEPGPNPTTIGWKGFAIDPESGANKVNSKIRIEKIPGETDPSCPLTPQDQDITLSGSLADPYTVDLTIPVLGNVNNVELGYCKYKLTAKILNGGANLPTYIGDTFVPVAPAPAPDPSQLIKPNGIIFYVRAGNPDIKMSKVTPSIPGNPPSALADGKEAFGYKIDLKDVAGNPIRDIHCGAPYTDVGNPQYQEDACPNREVTMTAELTNTMLYDLTQSAPASPYPTPIRASDSNPGATGIPLLNTDGSIEVAFRALAYNIEVASYAPTSSYSVSSPSIPISKKFLVDQFDYQIDNVSPLPATTSVFAGPAPYTTASPLNPDPNSVVPAYVIDQANTAMPANGLTPTPYIDLTGGDPQSVAGTIQSGDPTTFTKPSNIAFSPAVTTANAEIDSGGQKNILTNGVPADLQFKLLNFSSKAIASGVGNGGLSIDSIFRYGPASNAFASLMETHRIIEGVNPEDAELAWSDPLEGTTRYELYDGACYQLDCAPDAAPCERACDAFNSPFRGYYQQYHLGEDFCYDADVSDTCVPPNTIKSDGTYAINGVFSIPQEYAPLSTDPLTGKKTYPEGRIDRSDLAALELGGTDPLAPALPISIGEGIRFTPEKFVSATVTGAELELLQDIAYRYAGQPIASVYTNQLKNGLKVLDIGLQAKGTVSGPQIVTDRKFDTVGSESTKKLQEQIRRNVAQMISGMDRTGCTLATGETVIDAFDTAGNCYLYDAANQTGFKYYEGGPGSTLVLSKGAAGTILAPGFQYTVIVKGGANISILNDIAYPSPIDFPRSSLGLILIADEIGKGSNVYVSPEITNLVGTLYAEGSLISRNSSGQLYYGGSAGNVQELKNQLYWQGSIASRNTIGGAGIKKVPDGIACEPGDTQIECAQRYDLDYLRRFTAIVDATTGDSSIANDGKFSGGGCCGTVDCGASGGTCQLGTLPSIVKLLGDGKINKDASELSTTYIEREPRAAANPPPGFTVSGGQETTQTIR
ncbi:hypothetical protein HZA44_04655 [Candidatus Peregrinibacteria bacterium]|nr:hypothetical protein [Candidatus Peregrinibacteria bacterium]